MKFRADRDLQKDVVMSELRRDGLTLQAIADLYSISRQAVHIRLSELKTKNKIKMMVEGVDSYPRI